MNSLRNLEVSIFVTYMHKGSFSSFSKLNGVGNLWIGVPDSNSTVLVALYSH